MRHELEQLWLEITHTGSSTRRDQLKEGLLYACKSAGDVMSLPVEMKDFAAIRYWQDNCRRQGSYGHLEQQCIEAAVEYVLQCSAGLIKDATPLKTVELAYNETPATVRKWVSRRKGVISTDLPRLDDATAEDRPAIHQMLAGIITSNMQRHGKIWRSRV